MQTVDCLSDTPVAIGYIRVSTSEQGDSGLGLEAQRRAIVDESRRRGWRTGLIAEDIAVSGTVEPARRSGMSDALAVAQERAAAGDDVVLVVAKLDRATRSVGDLCELLEQLQRKHVAFVALDLGVDTTTPMGAAMAQISGVFAELERKLIGERTRLALAEKKAMGVRLGAPVRVPEPTRQRAGEILATGVSYAECARRLNAEGHRTATGRTWGRQHVRQLAASLAADPELPAMSADS